MDKIAGAKRLRESRLLEKTGSLVAEYERLRAQPDDIERLRQSAGLENEFSDGLDPKTAAHLIQHMPEEFVDTHFGALALAKWAAAARLDAARWMAGHPGKSATAGEALARGWFESDRSTLQSHLDELPSGPWKTQLAVTAGEDAFLAHESPAVVDLLHRAEAHDPHRIQLLEWNATAWAIRDADAAAAWAGGEPDAGRRETLLAAVAIGQANLSPEDAAERLFRSVTSPAALIPAVQAIARIWAARDPQAAHEWVAGLPEGDLRRNADEALSSLVAIPSEKGK